MTTSTSLTSGANDFGAWTQNGWRVGPVGASSKEYRGITIDYGNGMPYSPIFTYSFDPDPTTSPGKICNNAPIAGATGQWLEINDSTTTDISTWPYYGTWYIPQGPTLADGGPTQRNSAGNLLCRQIQYPQRLAIYGTGNLGTGATLTIFGYDFYGQPMQCKVNCSNSFQVSPSAFYGVVGVWYSGGAITSPYGTVNVLTFPEYGLPYCLSARSHAINFGVSDVGAPAYPMSVSVTPASPVVTETSGDPRGMVGAPFDSGSPNCVFTYYVQGADPYQAMLNQVANGANPSKQPWNPGVSPSLTQYPSVPVLSSLIGVPPFFTGKVTS